MGTRSHPLARSAYLGLGLVLLLSGMVRADLVRAEPEAPAAPLAAPAAPAEVTELPACGMSPLGVQTPAWRTGDEIAFGSVTANTATPWEASSTNKAVHLGLPTTRLTANETSGLLMFQSLLLVALVRKRRKWAAALLTVLALSRSGLNAISELVGLPKTRAVSIPPPSETTTGPAARLDLPFAPSERTYAGLLRRLAGEPAPGARGRLFGDTKHGPATQHALIAQVAGLAVPGAVLSPGAYIPSSISFAFLPSLGRALSRLQTLSLALFARPPPVAA